MTEVLPAIPNGALSHADLKSSADMPAASSKKSKENERRRRRPKQKKNNKSASNNASATEESDADATDTSHSEKKKGETMQKVRTESERPVHHSARSFPLQNEKIASCEERIRILEELINRSGSVNHARLNSEGATSFRNN